MSLNVSTDVEIKWDAYGFTVRPQYLETFKQFDSIYKKEEEERSRKWAVFLQQHSELGQTTSSIDENANKPDADVTENKTNDVQESSGEENANVSTDEKPTNDNETENVPEKLVSEATKTKKPAVRTWTEVRSSLNTIENMMCHRVKNEPKSSFKNHLQTIQEVGEDSNEVNSESMFPWKELESLVRGGVPRDIRGEAWQAFVGVKARRVESYYQNMLDEKVERAHVPEKCKKQIEKDLPRTFPGHPALNEEGRNSLRRLLLAYARHNPEVGYCQAMNFFAAMLLLMMPEENAFWTLVGMLDNYFDGYFTTDMIESQVDQLVFEDLMRERYPNLVNHFDIMGVEMGWICGPWFLSIFVNMIPWESVLRVWDVILFEGNRAMLLRTALALMELYGPDLGSTIDAGDAIIILQSLVGSTFDSSNLVVTACISFCYVTEDTLQKLRQKHRPDVIAAVEERTKGEHLRKSSIKLATKLYSFKKERDPIVREPSIKQVFHDKGLDKDNLDLMSPLKRDTPFNMESITTEMDSFQDLQDQAIWLKAQLCSMLEDKRSATLRAEELETAVMEMAQQDNRRELSAKIEDLEFEISELQQLLADKREQEKAMLEVLMRVEQEQKITEDARRSAERDAVVQRYLVNVLEEKYEQTIRSLAQMEKRALMAETKLKAAQQYDSGQVKSQPPGNIRPESVKDNTTKKTGILSFGLGWREKYMGKQSNVETSDAKSESNGYKES